MADSLRGWRAPIEGFLTHLRAIGRSVNTVGLRRAQLYRFARDVGRARPELVTLTDVEAWLAVQSWSTSTRRSHRDAVRSFFAWAERCGIVETSPVVDLVSTPPPRPNPRPVPEDDYRFAMVVGDERDRLMVRLAGEVGLRRAEVARVHSRDVIADLLGYSLVVHGKGDRTRVVPIKDDLARTLRRADGFVFPGRVDGHLSPAYVGKRVRALLPAEYSMHKLRTRFGSRAYALSKDIAAVQDMMGHSSPQTTRFYVAVPDDDKRAIIAGL